ncbi:hypothetical protein OIDMADRAFT_32504 [Oidiodendron maius Zn]|uniref:Uncharacterized protein n=1 Tax=Oidiodendron maius (strain Zn) TaxID=913774 RepID=A0A0C3D6I8_OIDMZ|nr:hypothetical protein OIDMADRAFT_32504 [Oidiodendron maius Zn]
MLKYSHGSFAACLSSRNFDHILIKISASYNSSWLPPLRAVGIIDNNGLSDTRTRCPVVSIDWAQDLYRYGIAGSSKRYVKTSGKELNDIVSISLDTNFLSINQGVVAFQQQMELDPPSYHGIAAWQHQVEPDPPALQLAKIVGNPDL